MIRKYIVNIITLLFITLWIYAAMSKLLDYNASKLQMSQSPFISEYAHILVWAVPVLEIVIGLSLIFDKTRMTALYASLFLMTMFSAYIYFMLNMSYHVPCSCGGILNSLGWEDHFIFNIGFVFLAIIGIYLSKVLSFELKYNKELGSLKATNALNYQS